MAFLTIVDGSTTLNFDVSIEGASEREPDRIGQATRAFSGKWRTDEQEFRVWQFTIPVMTNSVFETLRSIVKNARLVSVSGDLMPLPTIAIVRIESAEFLSHLGATNNFSRIVQISVHSQSAS